MIGKGKSISHTKASILYGWNQEKRSQIVFKNNLACISPTEVTDEFKIIQSMNSNCKRNTFSFVLSPTIEDGEKLSITELNKITSCFISEMKLINHQSIAFVHEDKKHKHIHLYVNRIDFNGNAYNDSFIGKKTQKIAEIVALKLGLKTVKEVIEEKLENDKDIRNFIKVKHDEAFAFFDIKNCSIYIDELEKSGIKVKPVINNKSKLQGFRYEFINKSFKGSEVHRSLSINNLIKHKEEKGRTNFKTNKRRI